MLILITNRIVNFHTRKAFIKDSRILLTSCPLRTFVDTSHVIADFIKKNVKYKFNYDLYVLFILSFSDFFLYSIIV